MDKIKIAHGSGGSYTHKLIDEVFGKYFDNNFLKRKEDSAVLPSSPERLVYTTDTHVVKPLFFPGGDIGKLSVTGTLNDLAVMGARPAWLSCGMVLEEGLKISTLKSIAYSMAETAAEQKVKIVTGDTKVVNQGVCDKIFINTSGIGFLPENINTGVENIEPGDKILISGYIGEHAAAIITAREKFNISFDIKSDCACLYPLIRELTSELDGIRIMRDPTRGGLATTLNEFVGDQNFGITVDEDQIPIREEIKGLCEPLGFDPLYLANEGRLILIIKNEEAKEALKIMQLYTESNAPRIIGQVTDEYQGRVILKTTIGSKRVLDMQSGEMLPRIC
ncbi:MAG: hydrogenase expression/formation protein HypE [Candidatus Marinimicrobia bacterium]|nr:hydrogenase expression/formation protein HypE [Candidatus Neomarinimicrobiota bacterium]